MTTKLTQTGFTYKANLFDAEDVTLEWNGYMFAIHGICEDVAQKIMGLLVNAEKLHQLLSTPAPQPSAERPSGAPAKPQPYKGDLPTPPPVDIAPAPKPVPRKERIIKPVDPGAPAPIVVDPTDPDAIARGLQKNTDRANLAREAAAKVIDETDVPELTPEQRSTAIDKIENIQKLAKEAEAEPAPEKRPGMDPAKVMAAFEEKEAEEKDEFAAGRAMLDSFKSKSNGKKGTMTREEKRNTVSFKQGEEYKGHKILQASVIETHYGEAWALTLDNGDSVLTKMNGTELEYVECEKEETPEAPGVTPEPKAHVEEGTFVEPPEDVLNSRKMPKVITWFVQNDPTHADGVNQDHLFATLTSMQDRLVALKSCGTPEKIRRRMASSLKILGY